MKDEDQFNIRPENLILISLSIYLKRAFETKRRRRESFGNRGRAINQYDLKGKWLNSFPSATATSRSIHASSGHILKSINEAKGSASGSIWRYGTQTKNLIKIPKKVEQKIASERFHSKPVSCYNMEGDKIREYENVKIAADLLHIQSNSIRRAIIGDLMTVNGFYWKCKLPRFPDHF